MNKITGNEPINAVITNAESTAYSPMDWQSNKDNCSGITIRQYFAAMAMQGVCAGDNDTYKAGYIARRSVELANALIEELNKQGQP